jgi:hypothetical protein
VGLSTVERDALDGHLEIHVVLDDTDTKLTALERPPTAGRRWRAAQSDEGGAGTPASTPERARVAVSDGRPQLVPSERLPPELGEARLRTKGGARRRCEG